MQRVVTGKWLFSSHLSQCYFKKGVYRTRPRTGGCRNYKKIFSLMFRSLFPSPFSQNLQGVGTPERRNVIIFCSSYNDSGKNDVCASILQAFFLNLLELRLCLLFWVQGWSVYCIPEAFCTINLYCFVFVVGGYTFAGKTLFCFHSAFQISAKKKKKKKSSYS